VAREYAYIVAYDISSPRRRTRVARHLEARGARVQKSVVVCRLTPSAARRLRLKLECFMEKGVDQLMIEPVSGQGFARPEALIF
jgi:CRISPR-associated protein Cas2